MSEEYIDVCTSQNELTGEQVTKNLAHEKGIWHRTAHVWVYRRQQGRAEEVLLQLRAADKDLYPSMWDISAAGHISAGEAPSEAALREMEEEIGLKCTEEELELLMVRKQEDTYRAIINNEYNYVYLYCYKELGHSFAFRDQEVGDVKWIDISTLQVELMEHPERYVPHGIYWEQVIKAIRERL